MELSKKGYVSQTLTYIKNKDYEQAYKFTKEMVEKFPDDLVSHYLLSVSCFWSKKYDEAALEGRRAFNKASGEEILPCAVITASAYYELEQFDKGLEILEYAEKTKKSENLEKLLFIFSMAKNNAQKAAEHLNELYKLNHESAEEMIDRYL